ncbi:hypothetical protein EPD60_04055 [Flaviaesturariibacter flavus]|uniref:Uncharacterized protein n=1 Tax=Flaviaesturariibacter flavus TaxID=2502780 RepID=A0A4R1BLT9_9BACT|nr:hypothetical protein [Flaviaesturariibacter flavus]TCJ18415.1 hypothetical protein EPD60_04055 [Flaviaesturariibacter flavus]
MTTYAHGTDNTVNNHQGKDWYFNSETTPAYAHSYLLTGLLSSDYVDLTGNGITDDDLGDAVKFNYSKVRGFDNPYGWRAPYSEGASYNEGLKTYSRDDKANYIYGEKELWFLHSIESKTMLATFVVEDRLDLNGIAENGVKSGASAKRLKEINLYTKADFLRSPATARPIKTVHFEYSYELCKGVNSPLNDSGKLTLKRVWFSYNGNEKGRKNPYVFYYHPNNPNYAPKHTDRWGSYKDPIANPGSTTGNLLTNADFPYAIQDSTTAAYNAGAWSLDSVGLPSGGSIKVQYESDEYAHVQNRRAMQMMKVVGMNVTPNFATAKNYLYSGLFDNRYILSAFRPRSVPPRRSTKNTWKGWRSCTSGYSSGCPMMYGALVMSMYPVMPTFQKQAGGDSQTLIRSG